MLSYASESGGTCAAYAGPVIIIGLSIKTGQRLVTLCCVPETGRPTMQTRLLSCIHEKGTNTGSGCAGEGTAGQEADEGGRHASARCHASWHCSSYVGQLTHRVHPCPHEQEPCHQPALTAQGFPLQRRLASCVKKMIHISQTPTQEHMPRTSTIAEQTAVSGHQRKVVINTQGRIMYV